MNKQPKQSARQANRQWAQKSAKKQQVTRPAGRKQSHGRGQARKFPSRPERQMKRSLRGKKPNRKRRKIRGKSPAHPRACGGHTCGEQDAHRVFFFPASRTHAAVSGCAPARGSCTCGEQDAHRVFFFSASRTHAAVSGCAPTHGSCTCGEQDARLRRAIRAPCFCLRPAAHARGSFRLRAHARLLHLR